MMGAAPQQGSSSSASLALIVASVLVLFSYALLFSRGRRFSRPLPPGPRGVPLLGSLPFLGPELHSYFAAVAAAYGPVLRLQLGGKLGVVISSAAAAREVLRDQDAAFANRDVPEAARVASFGASDIAWSPNGPTWRMLRRVCVREVLAGPTLDAHYGLRRRKVQAMVSRVASRADKGEAVDIGMEMFQTSMNIMTSMLWGGRDGDTEVLGTEFKDVVGGIVDLLGQPNLSDFYPRLRRFDLQGIEKKMLELRNRFDLIFERIIAAKEKGRRIGNPGDGGDFLDVMMRMEDEGGDGKTPFTRTNTKALLMDMVTGGTDTTSNSLEFVLAEMMNRPETICAAQAELAEAVGRDCMVEESDALKLRYLSAAIKEGMRLHPVLPLLVPHSPSEDCLVGGYTVPANSRVFINAWAIHRDPEAWEHPLQYKPERFLEGGDAASGRRDASGNDLSYIPFGSGRRMCAGVAMAERTLAHALATLLHCFDWQLPQGETGVDLAEKFGITLKKKKSLLLIPKRRLTNPDLYRG